MSAVAEAPDRAVVYHALWKGGSSGDRRHLYAGFTACCGCDEIGYCYGTSAAGRCCYDCFVSRFNCKHPRR